MDYATMADRQRQRIAEAYDRDEAKRAAISAELMRYEYLNIEGDHWFDVCSAACDEFDKKNETDEEFTLAQLVLTAYENGDSLLRALAAPYYEILRRHAAKLADAEVDNG